MKRRKIDKLTISPRRPYLDKTNIIVCTSFTRQIQEFCDEYLRAAMKLTITNYPYMEAIRASTDRIGYMLRLMVEYGGEDAVLETKLTINGRHDPAIIHRIKPVVDAAAAIAIADMLTLRYGTDYLR